MTPGRFVTLLIFFSIVQNGCGYHLRGNTREFFDDHGIRTIYVTPVKNNSYKAGIEITVYNALRKRIAQGGYVRIVDEPTSADAQFIASVQQADYTSSATTSIRDIAPVDQLRGNVPITSVYEARLKVRFELKDHRDKILWTDELLRSKRFSASTYYGATGSTSALINESEFERTLGDLSGSIVTDAEESINTLF